ncbi:MAG: four helix bundle protein [Clostridia bacterium]|nr:four helix bundle protein [Clostridia bacterium]
MYNETGLEYSEPTEKPIKPRSEKVKIWTSRRRRRTENGAVGSRSMELNVIQKMRELCEYVLTVTHKSPKEFRFTLTEKLHSYALSAMENILRANELRMDGGNRAMRRKEYQLAAQTDLKLLGYMSDIARSQKCILTKQYEQIAKRTFECRNLLGAWVKSDAKRASCASIKDIDGVN